MKGAVVYQEELKLFPSAKAEISIPTTALTSGQYIYRLRGASTNINSKLVIRK
jgi:hypothetical protein